MVNYSLGVLQEAWQAFLAGLGSALPLLLLVIGVVLALGLVFYALDREGFRRTGGWLVPRLGWIGRWVLVLAAVGLELLGLGLVRQAVLSKYQSEARAQFSALEDPDVGPVGQFGPTAAYLTERTFTRTLTLPPQLLERVGEEGVQVLAPYLQDPSAENVLRLADTFRRSGRDVVFTREVTRLSEVPVPFDSADVRVNLRFQEAGPGGRRSFYNASFQATYRFSNPLPTPARVRLVFPLPEQGGTLRGFELRVNDQPVTDTDPYERYAWEASLEPGATATATVRYQAQGSGAWRYNIASGRRPIREFKLQVAADRPVRFLRGALYPTSRSGGTLSWELRNVITAQQVELFFPGGASRGETLTKAFSFLPVALLAFLAWVLAFAWSRKSRLEPVSLLLASLGFALGLSLAGVLSGYLVLGLALLIGAVAATAFGTVVLGPRYLLSLGVSALLPLAFLSPGNSGLLLWLAAGLALASLLWPRARRLSGVLEIR